MSRGFVCDGCGCAVKGEPMLEVELSASVKKVSGNGRRETNEETRHYCQTCTDDRKFERDEYQPRVSSLVHGAVAASSWNWGTPDSL
jgi:hypothetical protein